MSAILKELKSVSELDQALSESKEKPVLLFKHSTTCPISARAFREFKSHLNAADPNVSYRMITVQTARPVSNEVAQRLQVQHETPQAILIRDGREIWNASHFAITTAALEDAIRKTGEQED
ncbi:MAG TPA: bacillithiol system redox-active protein YtxJ [Blastocatellia bacterium]|nr:bacillithiol system redox-active protein YtxJ [Blastocatellia bacterium]